MLDNPTSDFVSAPFSVVVVVVVFLYRFLSCLA